MTFEERNNSWDGVAPRYFRQNQTRSSSPRFWKIWVEGITVKYEWGQVGGAVQQQSQDGYVVNAGKKNEISAKDYALYLAREACRKKHWEGYREYDENGFYLDTHVTEIDFDNPPLNLAFWKPDNSPGPGILKKAESGKVIYARKMNGLMYVGWTNSKGEAFLTSRRMLRQHDDETGTPYTWNDRFPHIIQALQKTLPPRSCVLGELVAFDEKNRDNLHLIESYTKSLTPRAIEDQTKGGWAYHYIWDIAFWEGQPLCAEAPVGTRYALINEMFKEAPFIPVMTVRPGQYSGVLSPDDFRQLAITWGWEGWVMVDPDGIFGDRAFNFKGKPDRPGKFAAKVKPEYEDDFIVYWNPAKGYGEFSNKGRYQGGVESVCLYQLNSKGELVFISNCASGLTEEMKTNIKPSDIPLGVWKITYSGRRYISDGDKTNALDFPRFTAIRTDKDVTECINPKL